MSPFPLIQALTISNRFPKVNSLAKRNAYPPSPSNRKLGKCQVEEGATTQSIITSEYYGTAICRKICRAIYRCVANLMECSWKTERKIMGNIITSLNGGANNTKTYTGQL